MGGFEMLFPGVDPEKNKNYEAILLKANEMFLDQMRHRRRRKFTLQDL